MYFRGYGAGMKVSAHPMLVAVALGLLGPNALAAPESDDEPQGAAKERSISPETTADDQLRAAVEDQEGPYWTHLLLGDEE